VWKKLTISILLAAVLALTGYFAFNWFRGSSAAWQHIPSNAVVVVSSAHLQDSSYSATDAAIDLKRLPLLDIASDNLSLLNLIASRPDALASFLKEKRITYSFHPRTSTEWGVILYIPVAEGTSPNWLDQPAPTKARVLHHQFQDQKITDVSDLKSHPLFSYMIRNNFLIVSYYGDLIEDVVRASSLSIEAFQLRFRFAKINDGEFGTSIYLKNNAWSAVVPALGQKGTLNEFIKNFPAFQDLHIGTTEDKTKLTFKSEGASAPGYYLTNWFKGGHGVPFSAHKYISQQTSYFYRLSSNDDETFKERLFKWHKKNESEAWNKLNYHIGKESQFFLDNLGAELILCQLEENNSINDGKILLARFSNYEKLRPVMRKLSRLSEPDMNVSADQFQGYDVYSINIPDLPEGLYGSFFTGFPHTYLTYIAPYLVMSNNAQVLQNYIVDYENQLTWKQSPEFDSVLTGSAANAQLSLIVNFRKAQPGAQASKNYGGLTSKVESAIVTCRYDGDKAFSTIILNTLKRQTPAKVLNRTFLNIDIEWPDFVDNGLSVLQKTVDGSSEILLSNAGNDLLRTKDLRVGKFEALTRLNGPVVTESYKVDFLNIGRLQRVFATANSVYAVDEDDSSNVIVFSKSLPSQAAISSLFLIDGGKDGSSRFVVKTADQELYLWESVGKPVRRITRSIRFENILGPVVTLNQIGNRGLIVTERNGKIYLLGENGLVKRGFPVDILARNESPFTWTQNRLTGQPELTGVSAAGELIHISVSGKITSRRQLLRPEPGSTFKVLFDRNSLDWILMRNSRSKVSILTKEGTELFTIKDVLPNSTIQYHFFGVDNRFITIGSGGYTTIFDLNGRRLGDKAIPSELPVKLAYQPSYYKLLIFSRSEKKIQVWSVKLR
jgi:hypothetical protein